jgi:hypothetical protein
MKPIAFAGAAQVLDGVSRFEAADGQRHA